MPFWYLSTRNFHSTAKYFIENLPFKYNNITLWLESTSELYQLSNHRLLVKLVPTFADREQHDRSLRPYSRFSRLEPLLFLSSSSSIYSRGWEDPVQTHYFPENLVQPEIEPDLQICSHKLWPLDHRGSHHLNIIKMHLCSHFMWQFSEALVAALTIVFLHASDFYNRG
jgi:hypothetical protein